MAASDNNPFYRYINKYSELKIDLQNMLNWLKHRIYQTSFPPLKHLFLLKSSEVKVWRDLKNFV